MVKTELRAEPRIAYVLRGTLAVGGISIPCLIQNFSTRGFLIMCTRQFSVGDVLELRSQFYPGQFMQCKIEVRHISDDCLGTVVVDISESALRLCRQFVEEHYADRLKFG